MVLKGNTRSGDNHMSATILYIDTIPGDSIQETIFAGICRYAASRKWDAAAVPREDSRPEKIPTLLAAHQPLAGCIVECSDGRRDLPPRVFGGVPVVYLHAAPSLYGGYGMRLNSDNEAIAAAAFRELSAGCPEAFAVISFIGLIGRRNWSLTRERAFAALAAKSGRPFFSLPWKKETRERRAARLTSWLSALPRHTAIFAVNDLTASEVVAAARLCNRSIPRDLALLGVDNNKDICESSDPPISSIQIDRERTGYVSARMLGDNTSHKGTETQRNKNSQHPRVNSLQGGSLCDSVALCDKCFTVGPLMAVRRKSTGGQGRHEKFILEAVEMIRREACDGLTAAKLLKRFDCSRSLFELRFREATGHSVMNEILHVRLEKVFTLLSRTDTPIGAIADFCGFRSNIALHWLFKSRTGMSMREWREKNHR